jgi:ATP-binding cassette subfamily F protein 3
LLDEPTNHLDIESIIWLEGFLRNYEGSVILISHDIMFLDALTKRTIEIELGNVYEYKANYSKFKVLQAERREKLKAAHKNQKREIEHKQKLVDKFRAKKNKAKFAQSLIRQLDKMERVEIEDESKSTMKLRFPDAPRSGQITVNVKNMTKHFGKIQVLNNVDFQLERGGRIAFVGQNGQGKTTLSKIIAGLQSVSSGVCETGYNVEVGFYAQDQAESLSRDLTVLETLEEKSPPEMRTRLRSILGAFLFSGEDVDKKVSVLSGGERARVALACLLLRPVNLLILDEPTNHLDMYSKEVLKQALFEYKGSLIIVSHDRHFLAGLTDRTLEFRDHKLINYLGDVQYFLEQRKMDNMREVEMSSKSKKKTNIPEKSASKELSYEERREINKQKSKLERRVKQIEERIEQFESSIKHTQEEMSHPAFYEKNEAQLKILDYQAAKVKLEEAMKEWEVAHLELESFMNDFVEFS